MDFLKSISKFISEIIFGDKNPSEPKATYAAGTSTQRNVVPLNAPPEITSELEPDEFLDLIFWIEYVKKSADGHRVLRAKGTHKGTSLGFDVELFDWVAMKGVPVISGKGQINYLSIGEESDAFVQILNDLYQTNRPESKMAQTVEFTGLALSGSPENLEAGEAKIKLFFETEDADDENTDEDDYTNAEFYTNIDLANRRLEFREKDGDYRLPLMKAFTGITISALK